MQAAGWFSELDLPWVIAARSDAADVSLAILEETKAIVRQAGRSLCSVFISNVHVVIHADGILPKSAQAGTFTEAIQPGTEAQLHEVSTLQSGRSDS